jgi:hypothetical protein
MCVVFTSHSIANHKWTILLAENMTHFLCVFVSNMLRTVVSTGTLKNRQDNMDGSGGFGDSGDIDRGQLLATKF